MFDMIACACGLDPATESMVAQVGIAAALSAPFWFRERLGHALRRLLGREPADCDASEDELKPD